MLKVSTINNIPGTVYMLNNCNHHLYIDAPEALINKILSETTHIRGVYRGMEIEEEYSDDEDIFDELDDLED